MSQKKNEGIRFPTEIRVVGSYTDRLLNALPTLEIVRYSRALLASDNVLKQTSGL